MKKTAFFIGSTGQNVGKTTTCLGLLAGFKKRVKDVGFLKPIGQEHVESASGLIVDKDVILFKDFFHGLYTTRSEVGRSASFFPFLLFFF